MPFTLLLYRNVLRAMFFMPLFIVLQICYYSNYSSFILCPFKVVCSGALPAQLRSNNVVLRPERNRAEWPTGVRHSATRRPFQAVGPATEKAQCCRITVCSNSACTEERGEIRCNSGARNSDCGSVIASVVLLFFNTESHYTNVSCYDLFYIV